MKKTKILAVLSLSGMLLLSCTENKDASSSEGSYSESSAVSSSSENSYSESSNTPSSSTHEHSYAKSWSSDENKHWHADTCGCGTKIDEADHVFAETAETDIGTKETCSICGYEKTSPSKYRIEENDWKNAMESSNFTIAISMLVLSQNITTTTNVTSGNLYCISVTGGEVSNGASYLEENGKYYACTRRTNNEEVYWEKTEISEEDYKHYLSYSGANVLAYFTNEFSNFVYDKEEKFYKSASLEVEMDYGKVTLSDIRISFKEGTLLRIEFKCVSSAETTSEINYAIYDVGSTEAVVIAEKDIHNHTYSDEWTTNEEYHWHASTCGHDVKKDYSQHDFKETIVKPTYDEEGYTLHSCLTCDFSYKDTYVDKLTRIFTITWQDYDERVLATTYVFEGSIPTYDGPTIIREDEGGYKYTWDGWTEEVTAAHADKTYTAKYAQTKIQYSINYDFDGGRQPESSMWLLSFTVEDEFTLPSPVKDGYKFIGWFDENEKQISKVEKGTFGDLNLKAKWSAELNQLTVSSNNSSMGEAKITSGSGYTDEEITVLATPLTGYVFTGWYSNNKRVSGDASYTFTMPAGDYSLVANFVSKTVQEEALGIRPVYDSSAKTMTYGLYPQTYVSDSTLIASLETLTPTEVNGWYLYGGVYYAKQNVSSLAYSSTGYHTFDDGTIIVKGNDYWFKCEPIKWKVLSSTNDKTYFLTTDLCLDTFAASAYYGTVDGHYANNYKYGDTRTYLNGDFYNTAFALGNSLIQTVTVDNSASTTAFSTNAYACENTQDKVYLLSYQDLNNSTYFADQASRMLKSTDYSRARGVWSWPKNDAYLHNVYYNTRSPHTSHSRHVSYVDHDGNIKYSDIGSTEGGIRPAITLKIS